MGQAAPGARYYNAIVWQDTRTDRIASALERDGRGRRDPAARPGCRPATYFSGGKIQWILENVDGVREAAERGDAIFGNTDTWLIWNLTGGADGGVHVTDVTNASRTMLMDLETLDWDDELLGFFGIPRSMLPRDPAELVDPSRYGTTLPTGPLGGEVPLTGDLGDQQAATVGQVCFAPGEAKNTYGTGNFMLLNTGTELVRSKAGLLTTVCYQFGDEPAGLRAGGLDRGHRLGRAVAARPARASSRGAAESEALARQVEDNGGVYFVPGVLRAVRAVLALRRPRRDRRPVPLQHQRPPGPGHARGDLLPEPRRRRGDGAGLRRAPRRAQGRRRRHRQRAVHADPGRRARRAGEPPVVAETTALGAAYAAGLAVGFWKNTDELRANWNESQALGARSGATSSAPRVRAVEEGGAADAGLGGRRLSTTRPGTVPSRREESAMRSVALSPQAREAALDAMARPSSTCWSSAAASSARAPPSTPPPAA